MAGRGIDAPVDRASSAAWSNHMEMQTSLMMRTGIGLIAGAAISAVDNFAFGGEVSPIVIVGMLLLAASTAASVWGVRAAITAAMVWVWLPTVHVAKRLLGLADTIHP